jgi:pantoate kinase
MADEVAPGAIDADTATAFVPGHVTAFFSPFPGDDPVKAGSRGAGFALSDGVRVTVRAPTGDDAPTAGTHAAGCGGQATPRLELNGDVTGVASVERVLDDLGVPAGTTVSATSQLPIGTGFGVSGGLALGTALAADAATGPGRLESQLVRVAHAAEVTAGTGLGDVVAQSRGGIPIRLEPGAPPAGQLDGLPARPRIEYVSFGELSTEAVLGGETDRLTSAGSVALDRLRDRPTLSRLFDAARAFAREAELLVPEVSEAIAAVRDAGGEATMAMLGRSVVASGTGLSDAGYEPSVCRVHPAGATLVAPGDASAPDADDGR